MVRQPLLFPAAGGREHRRRPGAGHAFFQTLREKHGGGTIVIVAHGGVNRIIIASLLQIPESMLFSIEQDYAALNILEFYGERPVLKLLNHSIV